MFLDSNRLWTAAMMLLAAVGVYGGCRAVLDVLMPHSMAGSGGKERIGKGQGGGWFGISGRRAAGQATPIAAAALAAMKANQPILAMVIIFSTSVALVTLVLGLATLMSHGHRLDLVDPGEYHPATWAPATAGRSRRTWMLLLPAVLVVFVAGMRARFGWLSGSALLAMGLAISAAWRETIRLAEPHAIEARPGSVPPPPPRPSIAIAFRCLQMVLGLAVCAVGAWMMIVSASSAAAQSPQMHADSIVAIVVCPLLVLPVLGSAASAAQHGAEIITPLVGTVLLNLCLLLPVCMAVSYATTRLPLPFPPGLWHLDNVLLIEVGLFLLVAALRRWTPNRAEGMLLVAGYFVYLMLLMLR